MLMLLAFGVERNMGSPAAETSVSRVYFISCLLFPLEERPVSILGNLPSLEPTLGNATFLRKVMSLSSLWLLHLDSRFVAVPSIL